MSGETPPERGKNPAVPTRKKQPTRQLNLSSRVRGSFRRELDRLLDFDTVWSVLFVLTVLLSLGGPWFGPGYQGLAMGQIAPEDITVRESFDYPDMVDTERRKLEAREEVPDVYEYNADHGDYMASQLSSQFQQGRAALEVASLQEQDPREAVAGALHNRFDDRVVRVLVEQSFDGALERELTLAVKQAMSSKVVTNKASLEREGRITLISRGGRQQVEHFDGFIELEQARNRATEELGKRLDLSPDDELALGQLARSFVDIGPGRAHGFHTHQPGRVAGESRNAVDRGGPGQDCAGQGGCGQAFGAARLDRAGAGGRDAGFLPSALYPLPPTGVPQAGASARPAGVDADLDAADLRGGALDRSGVERQPRRAVQPDRGLPLPDSLGGGGDPGRFAGQRAYRHRLFGFLRAAFRGRERLGRLPRHVGHAGAVRGCLRHLDLSRPRGLVARGSSGRRRGRAFGFGAGVVAYGRRAANAGTLDIRLLELSNVNSPLLSEMAVRAPGSYNHSLVVGTLAEEAAKAIGANSLFCRVAAFYHDIGKMNKPEYFVENQRGVNPHDRLSPSMSALIIASHVKDGIKLAREGGLPEQIIDIIPQHHGTKLMTYFFEKAKKNTDPSLGEVKEEDFRYPGPKPQTREAAIFMLADAVEAAARTVDDPTANRLKEMIRKITNSIVVIGELDECYLTFADLNKIQATFLRCLVSMYHHRVDYPGFDFRKTKGAGNSGKSAPTEIGDRKIARGN